MAPKKISLKEARSSDWYKPNLQGGLCHCGCGKQAPIADRTSRKNGIYEGQSMRFCHGHAKSTLKDHTGERLGSFVLTSISDYKPVRWNALCDCGEIEVWSYGNLVKSTNQKCKLCVKREQGSSWGELQGRRYRNMEKSAVQRGLEWSLSAIWLWELFEKQNKRCALTGWELVMKARGDQMATASLDRIDNRRGYVENNVRWIHRNVNYTKSNMSDEDFFRLCGDVAHHLGLGSHGFPPEKNIVTNASGRGIS